MYILYTYAISKNKRDIGINQWLKVKYIKFGP